MGLGLVLRQEPEHKDERYEVDTLPPDLEAISKYYEELKQKKGLLKATDIRLEDIEVVLHKYETDLKCNIYTLMDVFHLCRMTLYKVFHSEAIEQLYTSARDHRAALLVSKGYNILEETYNMAKEGDSNRDLVNAARYLSSYCMSYAQVLSDEYSSNAGQSTGVKIQVNVPQFNNLKSSVVDVEPLDKDDN